MVLMLSFYDEQLSCVRETAVTIDADNSAARLWLADAIIQMLQGEASISKLEVTSR